MPASTCRLLMRPAATRSTRTRDSSCWARRWKQSRGEGLSTFCAREVFAPLVMTHTRFCPQEDERAAIPPTEEDTTFRHRIIQGEVQDENCFVLGGVAGHAGLFSNALDTLLYAESVLGRGKTTFCRGDSPTI